MNTLLSRFLAKTGKAIDEQWAPDEEAMLSSASTVLGPVLAVHVSNLRAARRCSFAGHSALAHVLKEGAALVQEVRARFVIADRLAAHLDGRRALAKWRERIQKERAEYPSFCAPRSHEIYFAYEDEVGATHVLFCDDATVTFAPDGGAPEVSVPPSVKSRALRSRMRSLYIDRARSYPRDEVRVPPAVPPAPEHSSAFR